MDLTTVFSVPSTHHVFGSRTGFSDSLVPSGVSFGGCWIVLGCFWEVFSSPGGEGYGKAVCIMGVPGQLMSQMAFRAQAQSLHPWIRKGMARQIASWGCLGTSFYFEDNFEDFRQTGETKQALKMASRAKA